MPTPSKIDAGELSRLYADGLGLKRLAKHFGVRPSAIHKRLRRIGVEIVNRSPPKKEAGDRGYCERCDAPLTSKDQRRFCSRTCRTIVCNAGVTRHGVPAVLKPCETCGSSHSNKRFCSERCAATAQIKCDPVTLERRRVKNLVCVRRYQARRLGQTPTDADPEKIRDIYANCPAGHEVDHRIPIAKGGLHHQDNLQYLPMRDNRRKGSKLPHEFGPIAESALAAVS